MLTTSAGLDQVQKRRREASTGRGAFTEPQQLLSGGGGGRGGRKTMFSTMSAYTQTDREDGDDIRRNTYKRKVRPAALAVTTSKCQFVAIIGRPHVVKSQQCCEVVTEMSSSPTHACCNNCKSRLSHLSLLTCKHVAGHCDNTARSRDHVQRLTAEAQGRRRQEGRHVAAGMGAHHVISTRVLAPMQQILHTEAGTAARAGWQLLLLQMPCKQS